MSQNCQKGALNWLAGQVRVLLKKMENLENGQSKVPIALDALVASSLATVQGGRTKICGQVASVFPEYIAPAPAASYATPASTSFAAPATVVDRISPDFSVGGTRSCGGASAYGVCFSSSCSVCRISSCGGARRCSAYTCYCRETHYSRSCSVCCTCSCG